MKKLKYWYYRVFKYRKQKFQITYMAESYFQAGDTVKDMYGGNYLCIGKDYYINYGA